MKLDMRNAYWHTELDDESSLLTTMINPFGHYHWCHLAIGLSVSGEIFQWCLTEDLAGLESVICVANDIAILSKDDATQDSQLEDLLRWCEELRIKLESSPDKLCIKCKEMTLHRYVFTIHGFKRKPPCIGGMELVSLSCNRVFISAESVGRGWCKIAIATKCYQFHTTDKCGFLFMPWITDQYIFVQYTKLVNKTGTAVAKVITFSIMTT